MQEYIKILSSTLDYISHEITEDKIIFYTKSNIQEPICPYCGQNASRTHSRYKKTFEDLPLQAKKVNIIIENRKMFCDNLNCNHKTFGENFYFLNRKSRKTNRLITHIMDLSVNMSSVAAQNYLRKNGIKISKSTICTFLKKR